MIKLIKGEIYRLTHTGHIFIWMIIASFVSTAMVIFFNRNLWGREMIFLASEFAGIAQAFHPMAIGIFVAVATAKMYSYKTGYYEVMDGSSPVLILLAKMIVMSVTVLIVYVLPTALILMVFGIANGIGEIDLPLYSLFYIILTLRITFSTVLFTMAIKNGAAAFLAFARYDILEVATPDILISLFPDKTELWINIFSWLPMSQLSMLGMCTGYESDYIMKVLVGFLVETVIFFAVTYLIYRNKRFA